VRHAEKFLLTAILLFCAALRLWPLQFDYFHPDEEIAVGVARMVAESGSLDTNWKNADLSVHFKLPQYNFSGYMLSAAGVEKVASAISGGAPHNTLRALRVWSALLAIAGAALTFGAARRLFGSTPAALTAALFVAVNPLLAQDGFYARPEPFVTVLTLILIMGGPRRAPLFRRVFVAALIAGILIATKVSILALLPLLFAPDAEGGSAQRFFPGLIAYLRRAVKELPVRVAGAILGVAAGFGAAAPFAIVNRDDYLEGLAFLMRQYSAPQWPYGLGEATIPERIGHVVAYFAATTGSLTLIFCVAGAAFACAARNFRALWVFACCFAFAAWFATYPTFFERNFSHVMPVVLIFAGYGLIRTASLLPRLSLRATAAVAMVAIAAFPAGRMTYLLLTEEVTGQSWQDVNALRSQLTRTHSTELTILNAREDYKNLEDENFRFCGRWLLEIPHYHGARSDAALVNVAAATGFKEVGRFTSQFAYVPTSSLHTYVMPTRVYFFRDNPAESCSKHGDVVDPRAAGAPFKLLAVEADPVWTRGGTYPVDVDFIPDDYFVNWSWTGGNTAGTLRMIADVAGQTEFIIPTLTSRETGNLSLRVSDRATGETIFALDPLPSSPSWTYRRFEIPSATREIVVEAIDTGSAGSDWLALGVPRPRRH
jgi:hypothetical protein